MLGLDSPNTYPHLNFRSVDALYNCSNPYQNVLWDAAGRVREASTGSEKLPQGLTSFRRVRQASAGSDKLPQGPTSCHSSSCLLSLSSGAPGAFTTASASLGSFLRSPQELAQEVSRTLAAGDVTTKDTICGLEEINLVLYQAAEKKADKGGQSVEEATGDSQSFVKYDYLPEFNITECRSMM